MSELRVDKIVNSAGSGAVEFTGGITLPAGQTLSGIAQTAEGLTATASVNTTGIITATKFVGDGSSLTGVGATANTRTNTLVVSGVSTFSGNVNISGDLTIDGTTTTIDSVNLVVEDKNIGIGTTTAASNTTADGGGFTLFGGAGGDKTLTWVNSTAAWTSNQDLNLTSGKVYEINGTPVLSSTQVLGKSVPSGTIVGDNDVQTLSCKTLSSGTLTGILIAGGSSGSNGQFLQSTGSGVQWATSSGGAIAGCCVSNFLSCNTCAPNISSGANNFLVGSNAGSCMTTGTNNNFFGQCAGCSNTSGRYNNFLGRYAGQVNVSGNGNNFFGFSAGLSNTTGGYNVFIGNNSGRCNLTGAYNTFIGARSGRNNLTGCHNIFFGCYAGRCNTTASSNIFIGCSSGLLITGGCNVVIGSFQGTGFTACCNHIFLSDGAGSNRLQINNSGALGLNGTNYGTAGQVLTSCGSGMAPVWAAAGGAQAMCITGSSTIFSCNAGSCGTDNFFVGCNAGHSGNGFPQHIIAIGQEAGRYAGCASSAHNTFLGYQSGYYKSGGCHNFFAGTCAGRSGYDNFSSTTGCHNTAIGAFAGACLTRGSHNFFAGACAGFCNTITSGNVLIGRDAGACSTGAYSNVYIGGYAGQRTNNGYHNIMLGCESGRYSGSNTGHNVFLGHCTGYCNAGVGNFYVGGCAGRRMRDGSDNIAFGRFSGSAGNGVDPNTACASNNFYAGFCAGHYNSTGSSNIMIGCATAAFFRFGDNNVFFGRDIASGQPWSQTNGSNNIMMGHGAGRYIQGASHNFFAGCCAGYCNTSGSFNFIAGACAGLYNTAGQKNVFIGCRAGYSNTTGENNVFIGSYAGSCFSAGNVTGSNNIAIGCASGTDGLYNFRTTGGSNIIVMGNNSHSAAYVKVDWTVSSDQRDKTNIIPIPVGKDFLKQLNPVQYQWADRETGEVTAEKPNYGFLAQDILAIEDSPLVIVDDHDPEHLKLRQSMIVPVLVKTVQELIEEVDALKEEVRILKGE